MLLVHSIIQEATTTATEAVATSVEVEEISVEAEETSEEVEVAEAIRVTSMGVPATSTKT